MKKTKIIISYLLLLVVAILLFVSPHTTNSTNISNEGTYSNSMVLSYTSKLASAVKLPTYNTTIASDDCNDIIFKFKDYNPDLISVTKVALDNVEYDLTPLVIDSKSMSGSYKTNDFNLDVKGTMNYTISYFLLSNNEKLTVTDSFRYVSTKVAVMVEAQSYISRANYVVFNKTRCAFDLVNKETGEEIKNAINVSAKYYIGNEFFFPTINILDDTGYFYPSIGSVFSKEGCLDRHEQTFNSEGNEVTTTYRWTWNYYVSDFDVVYITFMKDGEIVKGSCYPDGLHVEYDSSGNAFVYDSNGVLRPEYSANEYGLILDSNNVLIDTENPPVQSIDPNDPTSSTEFKLIIVVVILVLAVIVLVLLYMFLSPFIVPIKLALTPIFKAIGYVIKSIFKLITYPFVLIYKGFMKLIKKE